MGVEYLEQIEKKIDKFKEPPSVKNVRALPAPAEAPTKKRGGRRYINIIKIYPSSVSSLGI